ncbi:formate dehydrogenase cytochrome b556 subunit [Proteus terrae]|uniref:formate dehydrogenase cytochrome b556 subunit n=2 Tax=Proteus terrae TaxID=1574161 RepID=UPI000BFD945E|nr:formate dehydrogenase cytochrome b556 subunit [Proteus terrae]ATM99049.1 formate dehydrogenase cytochrome b556 subunit [Proteus vulgaris]MBG2836680.1 formate dehydrogenase cytochrome b556 subunit [Proteus terrae subsp. cibarius]MBG2868229.1 formate dehydrogenase cytochrome b556 subunit [Proteus terrae subsp. cibarius]MBJ2108684.1 formate dehydrogenase cytochrome b556 subunit [Proteus terrae]MBJ2132628.1 formate dehydrogenase cytochrome b556 subunit [Proteus terrae]
MMKKKSDKILRHTASERINHWVVAIFFIFTTFSGLGFFFPSLNWFMNILGTPQLSRLLHPFTGVAMVFFFIFMFFRYLKHNFVDKDDLVWAKNIHKVLQNEEAGDIGHYNLGQKGIYWTLSISLIVLTISGVIIWRPYFADYFSIPVIRIALLAHSLSAILLIITVIVHAYAAFWVKGSIRSMIEGWVTRGWAKKHHPRWYREILEEEKKEAESKLNQK